MAGGPLDQRVLVVPADPAPELVPKSEEDQRRLPNWRSSRATQTEHPIRAFPQVSYSMRRPLIALAITSCWICSVPSKMS
jgi:hypothetical protein